jgi:hypothetical protein
LALPLFLLLQKLSNPALQLLGHIH